MQTAKSLQNSAMGTCPQAPMGLTLAVPSRKTYQNTLGCWTTLSLLQEGAPCLGVPIPHCDFQLTVMTWDLENDHPAHSGQLTPLKMR